MNDKALNRLKLWRENWNLFCKEVLKANLDNEQKAIISAVQSCKMVAVASGTSRGKDYVSACACLCFLYLTPRFDSNGNLVKNTKVAMTAPTARQVKNIMTPEVRRLFKNARIMPGRLVADDIRTDYEEWFLTGFKADDNATEAWSGFHAVNTMFVVTEASGVSEKVFNAIEGNLQGNSRLLLVFNPNVTTGYAAKAMKSERFAKFRLNSLNAENVVKKKIVIPGQVDYEWVKDKVHEWCTRISRNEMSEGEGDFLFENCYWRPNDLFRVKVLGMFPKVTTDTLIPYEWVELAFKRYEEYVEKGWIPTRPKIVGCDVAGMGRDNSVFAKRSDNIIYSIDKVNSGGVANHMHVAGVLANDLHNKECHAMIDTIGEGAGVYSRLIEQGFTNAISCKNSENATNLHDITNIYTFANIRAYNYWALRDWLDPKNGMNPAIIPNDEFLQEATEIHWKFRSDGSIIIEPKEDIQARLGRSPDVCDAIVNTFYPRGTTNINLEQILNDFR